MGKKIGPHAFDYYPGNEQVRSHNKQFTTKQEGNWVIGFAGE